MKIKLISLILLLCMLFSSCGIDHNINISNTETPTGSLPTETNVSTAESTPTKTSEITKISPKEFFENSDQLFFPAISLIEPEPLEYHVDNITYIGDMVSLNNLFCIIRDEIEYEKIESDVPKNIVWKFQGVDYNLVYECSQYLQREDDRSDIYVDKYYIISEYKREAIYVMFEHNTDIVRHISIDKFTKGFQVLDYTTENEYIQFLSNVLGNQVDLSSYEIDCITKIENHEETKELEGFHYIPKDDDRDDYVTYYFTLNLKSNGYSTNNKIKLMWRDTGFLTIDNYSGYYPYNEAMGITEKVINYTISIIDKWINDIRYDSSIKYPIKKLSNVEFVQITRLFDKTYLVFETKHPSSLNCWNSHSEIIEVNVQFYVDYERLQQKMALEGVNP